MQLYLLATYELNDQLMFFMKALKLPSSHFDISEYVQFVNHNTRSVSTHIHKLFHSRITLPSSYHIRIANPSTELNDESSYL